MFYGRRQLYWSNGLRALLGLSKELIDEELAVKVEDEWASVLVILFSEQWRVIRCRGQEVYLFIVVEFVPSLFAVVIDVVC